MQHLNSRVKLIIQRAAQHTGQEQSILIEKFNNLTASDECFVDLIGEIVHKKSISPDLINKAAMKLV